MTTGTSGTLVADTSIHRKVSFETTAFNGKQLKGTWTLEVDGLAGGTLTSWSLGILESTTYDLQRRRELRSAYRRAQNRRAVRVRRADASWTPACAATWSPS
jgi:subtilisin-like proprotein convertase family protein